MGESMARSWWIPVLRGVLAIVVGLVAVIWPGITLYSLVLLFAAYALVDGVSLLLSAASGRLANRWWYAIAGVLGIAAGVVAFVYPLLTALALVYLIAAWAVLTGALEIAAAISLRQRLAPTWLLVLSGALSVLLGIALFAWPGAGALAWVWLFGVYALAAGLALLAFGFRLRGGSPRGAQRLA